MRAARAIGVKSGVNKHDVGIVLGSGWAEATESIGQTIWQIEAHKLPGFLRPGVAGHSGLVQSMTCPSGKKLLVLSARNHLYENHGVEAVVHGVRTLASAGVRTLVLTNGAGGIEKSLTPGTVALITDHINLTGVTPLKGPMFIDMTSVYSEELRLRAKKSCPELAEGVYVQFRGPQYETPAEVKMAQSFGGQMVGMSTALEAIAAREAGMEVVGLSLITNAAAGLAKNSLSHNEVIEVGKASAGNLNRILSKVVQAL